MKKGRKFGVGKTAISNDELVIALIVMGILIGDYYRPFKTGENKPVIAVIEADLNDIAEP